MANHEEYQYLHLVKSILEKGHKKSDRTGTGTLSIFGAQMRFDLSKHFPLLTTKKLYWKGIVEELLWFIKGNTNTRDLAKKNVHIWDANGSRQFLDSVGLTHYEEGDVGPIYGFQWRHYGAQYSGCHADYKEQGIDQLSQIIATLKSNPDSRRIVMNAWNPIDVPKMALPPCHIMCQFYVAEGRLSCQMYQRSCDMGLGVPFNIASYALLTRMIAHVCNLLPGELIHTLGDTHIYLNHIEALKEQITRQPKPFPVLQFKRDISNIDDFCYEDIELKNYEYHSNLKMEMAV